MKYTISESRLMEIFKNFMDLRYGFLEYRHETREFIDKEGDVFGYIMGVDHQFYYLDYSTEYSLNEMFGEITPELLFNYLKKEFPGIKIGGVE
jgi:hypothetical protein